MNEQLNERHKDICICFIKRILLQICATAALQNAQLNRLKSGIFLWLYKYMQ